MKKSKDYTIPGEGDYKHTMSLLLVLRALGINRAILQESKEKLTNRHVHQLLGHMNHHIHSMPFYPSYAPTRSLGDKVVEVLTIAAGAIATLAIVGSCVWLLLSLLS